LSSNYNQLRGVESVWRQHPLKIRMMGRMVVQGSQILEKLNAYNLLQDTNGSP